MNRQFLFGILTGVGILSLVAFVLPVVESYIPPTAAVRDIFVQTSWWSANDTRVSADNSSDRVYFVTDGSIIFNVTQSYP